MICGAAGRQKKTKYELFLLGLVGWGGKLQEAGSSHPAEGKSCHWAAAPCGRTCQWHGLPSEGPEPSREELCLWELLSCMELSPCSPVS